MLVNVHYPEMVFNIKVQALEHIVNYLNNIDSIANGGDGTLGTVDMDRINNRNERRLNELRNLGV
jgi:hypothetical protein